jgi:hypothetical protein
VNALGIGREHPRARDDEVRRNAAGGDIGEAARHRVQGRNRKTGQSGHELSRKVDDARSAMVAPHLGRSKLKYGRRSAYPLGNKSSTSAVPLDQIS